MRTVYLNGEFIAAHDAKISVFDRGYLFGDGIYEVIPCYNKTPFQIELHLQRLRRSLAATKIELASSDKELSATINELVGHHDEKHQSVYMQITRGTEAKRAHFYQADTKPNILMFSQAIAKPNGEAPGQVVQTAKDTRWQHCNVKAITLLANIMTLSDSKHSGFDDVIYHRHGAITEGSSSNVFIVKDGKLATPPRSNYILHGITRHVTLQLAKKLTIPTQERTISIAELVDADEVWLTNSTQGIKSVTEIDGRPVGTGEKGPLWQQLFRAYEECIAEYCQQQSEPVEA